jgi:hypothetical protein
MGVPCLVKFSGRGLGPLLQMLQHTTRILLLIVLVVSFALEIAN